MRTILTVFFLLTKRKLIFINSPLQFICCMEFLMKFRDNHNTLFVGYAKNYTINNIRAVENFYKKKKIKIKVIYLNEILNVYFFHFLLNVRKYFLFKFDSVIVGDYRYYLHRKIISISNKKIFVDDGFGSLYFNKFFPKKIKNSIFFTAYPLNYNVNKVIENNFDYLKNLYKFKKKNKETIFILPGLSQKGFMTKNQYFNWILDIKKKIKGTLTLVPHRCEINLIMRSKILKKNFSLKINYLPIELSLLKFDFLPETIVHNYSSCSITLNKILGKKIKILNYQNKYLENIIDQYNRGSKPNDTILPMKKFYKKNKLKFL